MEEPIRVAVIGAGEMSQGTHLPILQGLANEGICALEFICDLNIDTAKSAAGRFGFRRYTHEAEEALGNDSVEAVYVLGTAEMHYEYGKKALQNGKHIFIEKPPTPSSEHLRELSHIAEKKRLVAVVGFNRRFQKNIERIKDECGSSLRIYSMEAVFHKAAADQAVPYGAKSWLSANAIHALDVLCYLKGEGPAQISSSFNIATREAPQNFSAVLNWRDGTHAIFASNNAAGARTERYVVHGLGVSYYCDDASLVRVTPEKSEEIKFPVPPNESRGFVGEHREFFSTIRGGIKPRHSLARCLATLALTERIEAGYSGELELSREAVAPVQSGEVRVKVAARKEQSILVLNPMALRVHLPRLNQRFHIVYRETIPRLDENARSNVVALITGPGGGPFEHEYLNLFPSLAAIAVIGASLKQYNPEAPLRHGIPIINASDAYAEAVAEFIVMQALVGIRNASRSHDNMRRGGWGIASQSSRASFIKKTSAYFNKLPECIRKPLRPLWLAVKPAISLDSAAPRAFTPNFQGSTFGIIGYGEITQKLIPLLCPFQCRILIYSEYLSEEEARALGVERAALADVLRASIVSLQRGLSDRTLRSFGKREIEALRPGAIFINSARAKLVDNGALLDRLRRGDIFACLDVFEEEPLPKSAELRKLPNVFLTSHIAGSTGAMYRAAAETVVEKLERYLGGEGVSLISSLSQLENMT